MEAIGRYNLGYSARETVRYLNRRFRITVPEKTFRLWYTAHKLICTYPTYPWFDECDSFEFFPPPAIYPRP